MGNVAPRVCGAALCISTGSALAGSGSVNSDGTINSADCPSDVEELKALTRSVGAPF